MTTKTLKTQEQRQHLKDLLALNETISTVMILKEKLKHIWTYRSRTWAAKALDSWCSLARSINHPSVNAFVNMLERYRYGILNHCDYPIHTGKLEGVNNQKKLLNGRPIDFTTYATLH